MTPPLRQPAAHAPRIHHALLVVLVVVIADVIVQVVVLAIAPNASASVLEALHSVLLALVAAPAIWFLLMRPIHRRAVAHQASAEQALREASALSLQYRTIVETAQEGIWVLGTDGRTTYVNRRLGEMLGQRADAMLGRTFFDYMDEEGRALARKIQGKGGLTGRHDFRFRKGDGTDLWATVSASTLPAAGTGAPGVLAMLTEIAESRDVAAVDHTVAVTSPSAAECIVLTDADGLILWVNEAFERVAGYTRTDAVGKTPRILKSGEQDPEFYEDLWRSIKAGQVFRAMLINRKKTGELYYIDQTITPLRTDAGRITHFVASGRIIPTGEPGAAEGRASAS